MNNEQSEDITQDPEYIEGYERGVRAHNRKFTPSYRGFDAGWNAAHLASQKTVESKASPAQSYVEEYITRAEFEQLDKRVSELEKRIDELEKLYKKYTQE
jgi:hypothetical protein